MEAYRIPMGGCRIRKEAYRIPMGAYRVPTEAYRIPMGASIGFVWRSKTERKRCTARATIGAVTRAADENIWPKPRPIALVIWYYR
eukprot:8483529-Pyramimonas_sp.AAC.1